jgi:hypothetical protein
MPPKPRRVGRVDPATEAGALVAEWTTTYRRTDDSWRAPYTAEELAAVDAALDELVGRLPDPAESLFFRVSPPPEGAPPA